MFHVFAVVYDQDGQRFFVFFRAVFARHGSELSVGFVQRICRFVERKKSGGSHGFYQVGKVEVVFFQLGNVDSVFVDDNGRFSADQSFKRLYVQVDQKQELMQQKDSDHGYDPVKKRNGCIGHRNAREFCDQERDDQFEGLHFSDLAFSHEPHDGKQRDKDYSCA